MEGKELVEIIPIGRENAIRSEDLARLVGAKGIRNHRGYKYMVWVEKAWI